MKFRPLSAALTAAFLLSITTAAAEPLAQRTLTPTSTRTATRPNAPATLLPTPTIAFIVDVPQPAATVTLNELAPTATVTREPTLVPTATPTLTPRALPLAQPRYPLTLDAKTLAIDSLRARPYVGGQIRVTRVLSTEDRFTRVLFEYPSEGLRMTGLMHIPEGGGPFPVVILHHGYFKPSEYKPGDGTLRAADAFARRGYLALAPDYRCYGGSQCASNPLQVGFAIDVLNLLASLPSLPYADSSRVGIWGHSMGGSITMRVLAINDSIKVAALYAAVTGDDEVHYCWLTACRPPLMPTRDSRLAAPRLAVVDPDFAQELAVQSSPNDPRVRLSEIFQRSSPTRHLVNWKAAVMIHHGEKDDLVPVQWSVELAEALIQHGKTVVFHSYANEGHVFSAAWQLFMARTLAFFDQYLSPIHTPITATMRVLRRESVLQDSY